MLMCEYINRWPRPIIRHPRPVVRQGYPSRPVRRAECERGVRPCPFITCKYHLFADIDSKGRLTTYADSIFDMRDTCALDVADRFRGMRLRQIADRMNLSRERVRQIINSGLRKMMVAR